MIDVIILLVRDESRTLVSLFINLQFLVDGFNKLSKVLFVRIEQRSW